MVNGKWKMENTKRYVQRLSKVSGWLSKMIVKLPLCLANSRVSPATAGCLSARHGPAMTGWFRTRGVQNVQNVGGQLKIENGK